MVNPLYSHILVAMSWEPHCQYAATINRYLPAMGECVAGYPRLQWKGWSARMCCNLKNEVSLPLLVCSNCAHGLHLSSSCVDGWQLLTGDWLLYP